MGAKASLQAGGLNWNQTRFVEYYIQNGGNARQAYFSAYGSGVKGADQSAQNLLKRKDIQDAIILQREKLQQILNFKREDYFKILIGIATARISDFASILKDHKSRDSYKDLGHLEYALKSVEKTKDGVRIQLRDAESALNELYDKLGLGEGGGKGNWFDGLEQLMQLVRETKGKK